MSLDGSLRMVLWGSWKETEKRREAKIGGFRSPQAARCYEAAGLLYTT